MGDVFKQITLIENSEDFEDVIKLHNGSRTRFSESIW
jgi:hypothetical protein